MEDITDSLRVELEPFGMHVSAVEPGSIATEIWRKGRERDAERDAADENSEAGRLYAPVPPFSWETRTIRPPPSCSMPATAWACWSWMKRACSTWKEI